MPFPFKYINNAILQHCSYQNKVPLKEHFYLFFKKKEIKKFFVFLRCVFVVCFEFDVILTFYVTFL